MSTKLAERPSTAVSTPSATSLLQAITAAASNPQTDIEKMERLFAMHQQMLRTEAEAAFNGAMAAAQANIEPVAKKAYNAHTKSSYAKLSDINDAIIPIYTAEGLSVSFDTEAHPEKGWLRTVALVSHRQGHSRKYSLDLPLDDAGAQGTKNKTGVQATGSTSAYARRYLVCMIFNVSTFDDKDGNHEKGSAEPDPEGKKALEACGSLPALQKCWKEQLTAQQRSTLGAVKDECKARIEASEQAAK